MQLETGLATVCGPKIRQRIFTLLTVRCRTCAECLQAFLAHWILRSIAEFSRAKRSRMIHLSFAPRAYDANGREKQWTPLQVHGEVRRYIRRIRERNPGKPFRYCWTIERGEQATRRLHVHMLVAEYGDAAIQRRDWKHRERQNPRGLWFAGNVKTKLITETPQRAARYCLKYALKDAGQERLPGGRRIGASDNWGRDVPIDAKRQTWGRLATALDTPGALAAWVKTQHDLLTGGKPHGGPPPQQRGTKTTHPVGDRTAPTCAIYNQDPGASAGRDRPKHPNRGARPPPSASVAMATGIAHLFGGGAHNVRLIGPEEIPPEIRDRWLADDAT